jgi:aspartate carbamoyltransferase catalytic subunit
MKETNHFVSIEDLEPSSIENLIEEADKMLTNIYKGMDTGDGKILSTLFFEPSTRTRLSFESAMNRLGGKVISFGQVATTSVAKGEVLSDTIRTVASYCDIIAMRHPYDGSAKAIALYSKVPTINAGDGRHEHPTQTMLDLFTIYKEIGTLEGLKIVLVGDLRYGRTVHSLSYALSKYNNSLITVAPEILGLPEVVLSKLPQGKIKKGESLKEEVKDADVIYVTRIQKERFDDEGEYENVKGSYLIDKQLMSVASENVILMHPLPRVDEIAYEVDDDPKAVYFKQAFYGVPMRMAIIAGLLGLVDIEITQMKKPSGVSKSLCENLRCITREEIYLPRYIDERGYCYYCGRKLIADKGESRKLDI